MIAVLKRILQFARPLLPDIAGRRPADITAEREKLRWALDAAKQAEQKLEEAKAHTQRVLDVIDGVGPLEDEAKQAAETAAETTRNWAISGAPSNVRAADQVLLDRVTEARRRLEQARLMAKGAEKALPEIEQAEGHANSAVEQAQAKAAEAAASVMFAMLVPQIAELRQTQAAYRRSLKEIAALHRLWSPELRRWHGVSSIHFDAINQHVRELEIRVPSNDEMSDTVNEWKDFAKRLTSDPDATLSDGIEGVT